MPTPAADNPTPRDAADSIDVIDLGRLEYAAALDRQRRTLDDVVARRDRGGGGMAVLLVEHDPPVITVSRRASAPTHLLATPAQLDASGVTVAETDRGGDITYHGPGQLVVYPILDLNVLGLRLHGYMRFLEAIVIDTLATFGVEGRRDACATGVWVGGADIAEVAAGKGRVGNDPDGPMCVAGFRGDRKICAMGVRVSRWVTMHGLALNVDPDLDHFRLIVPCGLAGRRVTSLRAEIGDACPSMDAVKRVLVDRFERAVAERRAEGVSGSA
ncbi:MAG: lipoyl(octanoyl) transferase LipB [Phycisphaerales bacterium]|nr:lipoyl(octanoyl) transferase LipB [Phycisphaerales bacterium]